MLEAIVEMILEFFVVLLEGIVKVVGFIVEWIFEMLFSGADLSSSNKKRKQK